jgi:hypothetical protein
VIEIISSFAILILFSVSVSAQSTTTVLKEKSLIKGQTIYLNSKTRMGGKNRIAIPIKLPANTVAWYYSFTTLATDNTKQKVAGSGLEMQIAKLITSGFINMIGAGLVTNVASQLVRPTGNASVDIYLTNASGLKEFEKKDLVGMYSNNVPTFYKEGTAENSRNGAFQIPIVRNDLSLCLRNPSVSEGVAISLDVVAIVSNKEYRDIWSASNLESLYIDCLAKFSMKDSLSKEICDCAKNKIKTRYSPAAYTKLTTAAKDKIQIENIESCIRQLSTARKIDKAARSQQIMELVKGQQITRDFAGLAQSYQELIWMDVKTPEVFNGLAFNQLLLGQFDAARANLTIGLGKEPGNLHLLKNLGHYYLLTGDSGQAITIYRTHTGKKFPDNQKFKETLADDFKEFERLAFKNIDFEKVRKDLRIR